MKWTTKIVVGTITAGAAALITFGASQPNEGGALVFLTEIPQGYRDWKLISVARLTRRDGTSQLRAQLGNDIATKAYREEKLPFPDGAIIAALHWNEVSSEKKSLINTMLRCG
jgi:hypothetical protein